MEEGEDPRGRRPIVRRMEIDDIAPVFHLGSRLFTGANMVTTYRTWDEYEVTEYFNTDPEFSLVAEVDGRVVGFALGTTYEKEGTAWKYGYVAWIGVAPDHQGRGIGQRLYRELERAMADDGVRIMLMDTEAGNQGALRFFERMGFGKPRPQVWMSKQLPPAPRRGRAPQAGARRRPTGLAAR